MFWTFCFLLSFLFSLYEWCVNTVWFISMWLLRFDLLESPSYRYRLVLLDLVYNACSFPIETIVEFVNVLWERSFHLVFWLLTGVHGYILLVFCLSDLHGGCYNPYILCCRWPLFFFLGYWSFDILDLLWRVLFGLCPMVMTWSIGLLFFSEMILMYGSVSLCERTHTLNINKCNNQWIYL